MLKRLRESLIMPSQYYNDITDSAPESLKESLAKVKNRITESVSYDNVVKTLRESGLEDTIVNKVINSLKENGVNTAKQRIYKVPVAKINPPGTVNGNRRRYPKELWENVMNNQKDRWCGLAGLADHPTDDCDPGSIKNSSIVWLGMEIDPETNIVYGIGSFVGDYGHMFQEIIDCGGRVGFSSSGFGELMGDGETVNPDTYQIERLADVVLNPSQEVYGSINDETNLGNIEYTKQNAVHESVEQPKSAVLADRKNKITENKEVEMTETKSAAFARAEEKALRAHIKSFLNENTNIGNPLQRMSDLNEVLTIIHEGKLTDLEKDIVEKLEAMQVSLEKDIEEAEKMKEELGSDNLSEITENTKKLIENSGLLADQVADYKTLCEGLTDRNKELANKVKSLEFRLSIKEKRSEKENMKRNESIVANNAAVAALQEELADVKKSASSKIKALNESVAKYEKGNKDLERKVGVLETKLKEANNVLAQNAKLKEGKASVTAAEKEELNNLREENNVLKGMCERLQKRNADLKEKLEEAQAETAAANEKFEEATTPDIHVQPRFTERVSKYFNFRENDGLEVEDFWADQLTRYGEAIEPYEHQIRDAKTLNEAQAAFYKVMPLIDSDLKAARDATFREGGNEKARRMQILESTGMQVDSNDDVERANAAAREMRARFGLI